PELSASFGATSETSTQKPPRQLVLEVEKPLSALFRFIATAVSAKSIKRLFSAVVKCAVEPSRISPTELFDDSGLNLLFATDTLNLRVPSEKLDSSIMPSFLARS